MVSQIITALVIAFGFIQLPSVSTSVTLADEQEWSEFHADSFNEHADSFTALFNSYEVKRTKNGRLMIRQGDSGSFKFARKS